MGIDVRRPEGPPLIRPSSSLEQSGTGAVWSWSSLDRKAKTIARADLCMNNRARTGRRNRDETEATRGTVMTGDGMGEGW